jgi:hypothetical protein
MPFFTNDTERMRITSGGNVLIGTTTDAGYKLDVNGTGRFSSSVTANDLIQVDSGTVASLRARGGGYGGNYNTSLRSIVGAIGVLQLGNNADNYILAGNTLTGGFLSIRVNVSAESITSGTEALRIFSNGRVFVGSSPSDSGFQFDVSGSGRFSGALTLTAAGNRINSGNELRFYRADNAIYTQLYDGGNASGFVLDNRNGEGFSFQSAGTNQLRIANTGAATFSTTSTLGITIVTNDVTTLKMNSTSGATKNWGFATTNLAASDFGIYQSNLGGGDAINAGTAKLYFTGGGNVLIGTTTDVGFKLDVNGTGRFSNQITGPSSAVTEGKFNFIGYNNGYGGISSNTGFSSGYNSVILYSNFNSTRSGQGNTGNPSWYLDLGGSIPDQDAFNILRSPSGSFTFTNLFKLSSSGAATFSSSVTATQYTATSTGGSGLRIYGASGTNQWDMYLNGANIRFSDNTGTGSFVVDRPVYTTGNFTANSSGIAEIRLQGGGYGGSYNTSLRSIVGAPGVLQMGNNGGNYILAGNTLPGGLLEFRVNCNSESVTSGSLALRLNADATATFAGTVTAPQFNAVNDRNYLSRSQIRLTSTSNNASTLDISVSDSTTNIYSNYFSGGNDNNIVIGTYANLSNQLYLANTGNVGIRTTNPARLLHVSAPTGAHAFQRIEGGSGGYGGFLELMSNSVGSGTDSAGRLDFYMTSSNRIASIDAKRISAGANYGTLIFSTADNSTTPTERIRITSSGFVGVNTDNPAGLFTVQRAYSASFTPLYVGNTNGSYNRQSYDTFVLQQDDVTSIRMVERNVGSTDQVLTFSIGDGNAVIASSGQPMQFYVNGSPTGLAYTGLGGSLGMKINTNQNVDFGASIKTGNPSGSLNAAYWRLGDAISTSIPPANRLVRITIDGTLYSLLAYSA